MTNDTRTYKSLKISIADSIAQLVFSQPEKANAMTRDFWMELPAALADIDSDSSVRALIVSGEGKHFSSGMDLSVFANNESLNNSSSRERERLRRLVVELQDIFSKFERFRFPVIAAIQGACIGGALDLICACDLRYATKQSFFCLQEINLAMMADLGVLQRLPNFIPDGVVRELAYTGDKLSAERALQLGLLNAIFDSEEEMMAAVQLVAVKIAGKSPLAISATKEAITFARDNSVDASLAYAAILQSSILDPAEIGQAAVAASKKTDASFEALLKASKL